MGFKKRSSMFLIIVVAALCGSGCASMQNQGIEADNLRQLIKERDAQISRLQEIADDQQQQLRGLNDALNECKAKLKN